MKYSRALALEDSERAAELVCAATCRMLLATCDDPTQERFERWMDYLLDLLPMSVQSIEYGIHAAESQGWRS